MSEGGKRQPRPHDRKGRARRIPSPGEPMRDADLMLGMMLGRVARADKRRKREAKEQRDE